MHSDQFANKLRLETISIGKGSTKVEPFFCFMLYLLMVMIRGIYPCSRVGFVTRALLPCALLMCLSEWNLAMGQLFDVTDDYEIPTIHIGGYLGSGISFADFNGDGIDDLSFGHHNGDLRFFAGNGVDFDEIDLGISFPVAESKGLLWTDIDNDGDQDLLVTYRLAPNKLFRNDGNLNMDDVSATCGIAQDNRRSFGASFGDYNNDGLLDLFIANYSYASDLPGNELYENLGEGQFQDVTNSMGVGGALLQCFQGQWMDYDRDGDLDLHVIRDRLIHPNLFFENQGVEGGWGFVEIASDIGLDVSINCMSTSPCDYDRDGDLDLFLSGGLEGNVFMINDGSGIYTAADEPLSVLNETCWSAQWFDGDCNGWEDLQISTGIAAYSNYPAILYEYPDEPDVMLMNMEGELSDGLSFFQTPSVLGFATATSDFNNDGFIDLVSHRIGLTAQVWKGIPNGSHWIKVRPTGTVSNRDGVGTKIELWLDGVPLYRETYCGENYLGQNSRWEHFGLGEANAIDSMIVEWSSGLIDVHYGIPTNISLVVTEGVEFDPCAEDCAGCMYIEACNFDELALEDDGSCEFSCWYESNVCGSGTMWSSTLNQCIESCPSDINDDEVVNVGDLLMLLASFGSACL